MSEPQSQRIMGVRLEPEPEEYPRQDVIVIPQTAAASGGVPGNGS